MTTLLRIGTRESQLAVWQAQKVKNLLSQHGYSSELVYIKSEGDLDLQTPLYQMGVQGVFTRSLDIALLNGRIDIAVHSMKDVPTQLPRGIAQAAVLPRGAHQDILVYKNPAVMDADALASRAFVIATGSIRRRAQWLHRYPQHRMENLRGNVNTRLRKLQEEPWDAAIFAQAGLERIGLRPAHSVVLDWMLPAPAQGAIMVVCREADTRSLEACRLFDDENTALCTRIERDFLKSLLGGCSVPISGLAAIAQGMVQFQGNIVSPDGKSTASVEMSVAIEQSGQLGANAAEYILQNGGKAIIDLIQHETA